MEKHSVCTETKLLLATSGETVVKKKDIVEKGGGGLKVKRDTQIYQEDVFIKALIDGKSLQY